MSSSPKSASELAAETGEPVEVVADRTEYSQTMANPDGTFTLTQSTVPSRAKVADGSWQPIDTTLEKRPDGTVGPKSAVVDLSFSGGGEGGKLIRLGVERGAVELGWRDSLPEPVLAGSTATYPEVLRGVDLQLTATAEGFREVLVVKSAEAAANPELDEVRLTASGEGLTLARGAGGGIRALDANGNAVFSGPAGQMWDSAGDAGSQPQMVSAATVEEEEPESDPAAQPDKGDASAVLPVQVTDTTVSVRPDKELLRGADTVYPVYIDPPLGLGVSERSVISSDGDRWWQFNGDYGVGRCYRVGPYYCDADHTNRMLFEFAPSKLVGKHVVSATFRAYETWSFSCSPHVVDLVRTDNISEATRWPGPTQRDLMGDVNISAGRGDACSPSQPDAWVEFRDNASETDENLTATVRDFAAGKFSRLTLMLKAHDESNADAWKRFDDNAELQVTYVPRPGVPTYVGQLPGDGTTYYCEKSQLDPLIVTRQDPMVQAMVQTQVQPTATEFRGSLRAYVTVDRVENGKWVASWAATLPSIGYHPDDTAERTRMAPRADNTLYRMRALTNSYWTTNGSTYSIPSAWSPYCYFKIDTLAPKAPVITSKGPYVACADACEAKGGAGEAGAFTFAPSTSTDIVEAYQWWLDDGPVSEVTEAQAAQGVAVTPMSGGEHTLTVRAKDVRERWGDPATFRFSVASVDAVARWRFDDTQPSNPPLTAADSATEGSTRYPATISADEGWSPLGRRGAADKSLRIDSLDATKPEEYAATAGPVVSTASSFTVSAWAYLTETSKDRTVLAAPGTQDAAFALFYSAAEKKWVFRRGAQDAAGAASIRSLSTATAPSKVWTHLTGVFDTKNNADKADDTVQLFVNGRPQGQPVVAATVAPTYTPWASTTGLQFGRTRTAGAYGQYFRGLIDEVVVWNRARTPVQVRDEAKLTEAGSTQTALVAHWDTAASQGVQVSQNSGYGVGPLTLSASGAVLNAEDNTLVLDGVNGYASTTGPVIDETGSFTVSADVSGDSSRLAGKPIGYRAQVAGQRAGGESSWGLWLVKHSETEYLWQFTRTVVGADGKASETASVTTGPDDLAMLDTWVRVTGVYDAQQEWTVSGTDSGVGKLHLYVQGNALMTADRDVLKGTQQGAGELAAGRGTTASTTGNYLPGALQSLRIWSGAMSSDQILADGLAAS